MFCGKCGKNTPNGYEYCINCGEKLEIVTKEKIGSKNNLKKLINKKIIFIIFLIVIIAMASTFVYIFYNKTTIEGVYKDLFNSDDNLIITELNLIPSDNDNKKGEYTKTFTSYLSSDSTPLRLSEGSYEIKENKLIITDSLLGTINTYEIYKNYLIAIDDGFEGYIPDSDKFNATSKGEYSEYIFKDDGTLVIKDSRGTTNATYERNKEIIKYTYFNDKLKMNNNYTLFIYNNKMTQSNYYKN